MAAAANLLPVSYIGVLDYRVRFSSRSLFRLASGCSKHCLDAEVAVRVHPNLSSRLRNREKATFCPVKNAVCFRTVQLYNDLLFSNFLIVRFLSLKNPFLVSQFAQVLRSQSVRELSSLTVIFHSPLFTAWMTVWIILWISSVLPLYQVRQSFRNRREVLFVREDFDFLRKSFDLVFWLKFWSSFGSSFGQIFGSKF